MRIIGYLLYDINFIGLRLSLDGKDVSEQIDIVVD